MIRVMLVDDHPVVRFGLRGMLDNEPDIEVCAEAAGGIEAVPAAANARPDVVLMDLRMPNGDGFDAVKPLAVSARVIVLTTYHDDNDIARAMGSGAVGYLLKDTPRAELLAAIRSAHTKGRTTLSASVAGSLTRQRDFAELSERETEVLRLVARGMTNFEIGAQLHIAESTVKTYLLRVFTKLEVTDRTAAVMAAVQRRML